MIAQLNGPRSYTVTPNREVSECEAIVSNITSNFSKLLQLYRNLPAETLQTPTCAGDWSIKDTFAIVSAWVWRCAALLEAAHMSNGPLLANPDVDGLNREFYNNRHDWTYIDVEMDFYKAHQVLLAVLKQFPPERLIDKPVRDTLATQIYQRHTQCYERVWIAEGAEKNEGAEGASYSRRRPTAPHKQ